MPKKFKLKVTNYLHALLFVLSSFNCFSQAYQFKSYNTDNGISQPYVYTINQDKNGYLWIGTGEGLCKFDGISFKSFYTTDGIAENFITSSYKDRKNNMWLGFNQGSVTVYDGKNFKSINTSGFTKSPVTAITADEKGNIWCATQNDGVFRISKIFEVTVFKLEFDRENIYSIAFIKNDQLLVGTANGLKLYQVTGNEQKPKFLRTIEEIPETQIKCIVKKNSSTSFWVGTEDSGLFLITPVSNNQFKITEVGADLGFVIPAIQAIYEDPKSNLWLATFGKGVYKLLSSGNRLSYQEYLHLDESNGLTNNYIKSLYNDHEGNVWVGTYGSGIIQITDNSFSFFKHQSKSYSNNVTSILIGKTKWFGLENGLLKIDMSTAQKWFFYNALNGFQNDRVTSLYQPDSSHLYIGTERNGVYLLDTKTDNFTKIPLSEDELCNSINCLTGYGNVLWIATKNGIFKLDPGKKITTHYTTETGLPHNNINYIYYDKGDRILIGTHSNFLSEINIKTDSIRNRKIYDATDLLTITGIIKGVDSNIWACTFGNGLFKINDNITRYTTEHGLASNYCYGITDDGSNNLWIGHRMGLSRFKVQKDIIEVFSKNEGITGDCNYNALVKDENGNAWFGTTDGAIRFDPHKDKKNIIPPIVNIASVKINDKDLQLTSEISLPYDNYKIRLDFIGISFKANSNILYQYKLEGFDADWSERTKTPFVQYGKLSDGEYTFLLKAYNSDGIGNNTPLKITINIEKPFWKKWWFIVLVLAAIFYAVYFYIKIREKNHRKFQAQLQKALNEKTREVIIQKEEIEKKNKDITDSIRYAKRIQDALLPDVKKLTTMFPESFIFFQPRDIVSGDFYWYEKYGDKVVIACADATGHGVPGAFMSMIGSTLLKDITSRKGVTSPAFALAVMDEEIRMLLKQHDGDHDQTQDSVDIVICEIDRKTNFVRICSTRRSVFVVHKDELKLIKKDNTDSQQYDTVNIQLDKGDIIYMFTDGYPDQFGGEKGKKIKSANMKQMLEQIRTLPFDKQEMIVDRYFNRWKEGYDQVDDVLFIAIRI
ncbi:MAG: serine/threonine protein kinase [Bacteroidota bacterium]|jgi:ligand-binding sensor domain-containing protein|nr:serine/threonine protein kinase [Bacteroidota bacterium]